MPRMKQGWLAVFSLLTVPLAFANGCGDDGGSDSPNPSGGEAGATSSGGDGGTPAAGGDGATSSGGDSGEPAGGNDGEGGSNGNGDVKIACRHPYGTYCEEFTGTLEETIQYASQCSNFEQFPEDECPKELIQGTCTYTEGPYTYVAYYYQLDSDELDQEIADCAARDGTWAMP